jgi:hypothetical protein
MFNTMASTVIGPMDIFYQAGVMWNYFQGLKPTPFFESRIVTIDGKPFKCLNGTTIMPDESIRDVDSTDLIIVSSILAEVCLTNIKESKIPFRLDKHCFWV